MLQVITGGMFAGKTEELLRRLERYIIAKRRVALIRPSIDIRNSVTHNGKEFSGIILNKDDITTFEKIVAENDVIGLDEAQFFSGLIYCSIKKIVQSGSGKIIIAAGLDMDYTGQPFSIMPKLMALADDIVKLHAVCEDCYKTANISYRMAEEKGQIVIGAKEKYKALCWDCVNKRKSDGN